MFLPLLSVLGSASAATLAGRMLSEDGDPLVGAEVIAYDERLNYGTATTTNDGSWSMTFLPAGRYRIRAMPGEESAYADRFYPSEWDFCSAEAVNLPDGGEVDGLDITVPLGGTLSGVLQDLGGNVLGGAAVYAQGVDSRTALGTRGTVSGEDGTFTIQGLDADPGQPTDWQCYVDLDGFPAQWLGGVYDDAEAQIYAVALPAEAPAGTDVGENALLDGIRVTGTVYGPAGAASAGTAYVYSSSQVITSTLDADGLYVADGLPPGDVISWATVDGLATTYWPDADRPTPDRVSAPDEGAEVDGVDLNMPAESVLTVQFSGEDADYGSISALLYNDEHTVGRGGPVADDGTMVIDGLWPGDYDLYVYGSDAGFEDGFAFQLQPVDGETHVDVVLTPAASITGQLTDDEGNGVYGGYVYAFPADDAENSYAVASDEEGNYALLGLPAGYYTVRASYVNYCPLDRGFVTVWWQDQLSEEWAAQVQLASGQAQPGTDFHLPDDDDHDAMGDAWERANGLDTSRDDAAEDLDGDGFTNIEEYLLGTDPDGTGSGLGGCKGCSTGGGPVGFGVLALAALGASRRRSGQTAVPRRD